jgi:hypothetical protein
MATELEKSTKTAKKLALGCGILILVVFIWGIATKIFAPPATVIDIYPRVADKKYGQLPTLTFTSFQLPSGTNPEFRIDTINGQLPTLPTIANVFRLETPRQSLSALDDATSIANTLGFQGQPNPISATELQWVKGPATVTINKLYSTVDLVTEYKNDPDSQAQHVIVPDTSVYTQLAQSILEQAELFPTEYENLGRTSVTFMRLNSSFELEQTSAASEANLVRVDFFKKNEAVTPILPSTLSEDQKKIYKEKTIYGEVVTENPYEGQIYVVLKGTGGGTAVAAEIHYKDWKIKDSSTYQLLPLSDTWKNIQENKGYLRSLVEQSGDPFKVYTPLSVKTFLLNNIEIVYFAPGEYSQYIQPVYKFSGLAVLEGTDKKADFVFYYPAVKPD